MTPQNLSERISVAMNYDHTKNKAYPKWIHWNNRLYPISKIGLHHTYKKGETLYHVFSVKTTTLFMRLVLDTKNLNWTLDQIYDAV